MKEINIEKYIEKADSLQKRFMLKAVIKEVNKYFTPCIIDVDGILKLLKQEKSRG